MANNQTLDWELVRTLATGRLNVNIDAYYAWRSRNTVPHWVRLPLIRMSAGAITAEDFDRLDAAGDPQAAE